MSQPTQIPELGDVAWIDCDPQSGREQAGRRPALVVSSATYNGPARLLLCCPITSKAKGYPFEVQIPDGECVTGMILADQVKCLDWQTRNAVYIGRLSAGVVEEAIDKIALMVGRGEEGGR